MRKLIRIRDPKIIPAKYHGPKRLEKTIELFRDQRDQGPLTGEYWKARKFWNDAKEALKQECGGVNARCAYCESPTAVVSFGDVEHFRPKSFYWWLAYCYDNYTFSCQICNQKYKSDKFPLADPVKPMKGPDVAAAATDADLETLVRQWVPDPVNEADGAPWQDYQNACAAEKALLPDLFWDQPGRYFAWEVDDVNQRVKLVALNNSAAAKRKLAAAEECFGLNRPELLGIRYEQYLWIEVAFSLYTLNQSPKAKQKLDRCRQGDLPYSGMGQFFLDQWGFS
jgi:hypothetical protein